MKKRAWCGLSISSTKRSTVQCTHCTSIEWRRGDFFHTFWRKEFVRERRKLGADVEKGSDFHFRSRPLNDVVLHHSKGTFAISNKKCKKKYLIFQG